MKTLKQIGYEHWKYMCEKHHIVYTSGCLYIFSPTPNPKGYYTILHKGWRPFDLSISGCLWIDIGVSDKFDYEQLIRNKRESIDNHHAVAYYLERHILDRYRYWRRKLGYFEILRRLKI